MHQFFKTVAIDTFDVLYEESHKILIIAKKVAIITVREIASALFSINMWSDDKRSLFSNIG